MEKEEGRALDLGSALRKAVPPALGFSKAGLQGSHRVLSLALTF